VLAVGIDLQCVGEARGAREFEALHHGTTLAAIGVEAMNDHALIRRMKRGEHGARRLAAPVVDDENRKLSAAQKAHRFTNRLAVIEAGNDGAALESHGGSNPIWPEEHAPSASV
jgi:hypothetical protein